MAGEDLTSAAGAAPPAEPWPVGSLTSVALGDLGEKIAAATWDLGLPSWFWGEGVCLAGMTRFARATGAGVPVRVRDWFAERSAAPVLLEHINNVAPGIALADLVEAGEDWAAPIGDRLAAWAMGDLADGPTRAPDGTLEHWPAGIWADTAFMAGAFLARWGVVRRRPELVAEALRQVLGHYRVLQHPDNGLAAHGAHRGDVIWCHWGRANAWLALAAVEVLLALEATTWVSGPEKAAAASDAQELADRLWDQLVALETCQPSYGIWDVLVDGQVENAGLLETSAAAGIAAAMYRAAALLPTEATRLRASADLALRGVAAHIVDGVLTRVSAGTVLQLVPFGYSVIRDDRPQLWGQGLALHAIAAALTG